MVRHCRTALTTLAVAVALTLPVPLALAQGEPPFDHSDAPGAPPDDPPPPDQRAVEAPATAPAIKQASPDDPAPPDQRAEDAPAAAPAIKQASPDDPAPPDQRAEDAPTLGPAITQAPPDDPPPPDQRAEDAPTLGPAITQAPPDDAPPPDQRAEDAPALGPAITQAQPQGRRPSRIARRLAGWTTATEDNAGLPFLIVDKLGAYIFAFDADGEFLGSAPVLVGLARGDDSAPGIGDLKLSQISADQRTTPAGRFVARFGASDGHGLMLWVDLPDAISLHPVMSVNPGEHRLQRIASPDSEQHRISYGCINVPEMFYDDVVLPALGGGAAVVYILPDTKPMRDVFPGFAAVIGGDKDEAPGERARRADLLSDAPVLLQPPD